MPRRKAFTAGPPLQRLERAACDLNPLLLTVAIGLLILDLTCFITVRCIGLHSPGTAKLPAAAEVSLLGSTL